MQRRHFLQFLTTLLSLQILTPKTSRAQSAPRKFALLIGINDYPQGKTPSITPLSGCINDVHLLQNLLQYRYGFAPSDIQTLTNTQATRTAILTQIRRLIDIATPDDIVVIAFSGHGSILQDPNPLQTDDASTTTGILPYDYQVINGETNYITGTTLFLLRSAFKTNKVTTILDCCYAGGGSRTSGIIRSANSSILDRAFRPNQVELNYQKDLQKLLNLSDTQLQNNRRNQTGTKGILLAAAQDDEPALDALFSGGYYAGAFTKFLTEELWQKPIPLDQLYGNVSRALRLFAKEPSNAQSPSFIPTPSPRQPTFFTNPLSNNLSAHGVVLSINRQAESTELTLWLGAIPHRILNMPPGSELKIIHPRHTDRHNLTNRSLATLRDKISPDFTAIATFPADRPLPPPGSLVQLAYRPLPINFKLNLGITPNITTANITTILPKNLQRRITVTPIDLDNRPNSIDIILTQTSTGRYGLQTQNLKPIEDSFGSTNESIAAALDRLQPQLQARLLTKLFSTIAVTPQELESIGPIHAQLTKHQQPEQLISLPNQILRTVKAGETINIQLEVTTNQKLDGILIGISPKGGIKAIDLTSDQGYQNDQRYQTQLLIDSQDGVGIGELLFVIGAQNSLRTIAAQLETLIKELTSIATDSRSRTRSTDNTIDVILDQLNATNRSPNQISNLVISLPILIER
jgi:hypothetical protein